MGGAAIPNNYFTAILTDLQMPVMTGQNLILSIRKYENRMYWKETPIIVISGNPSENERAKCLNILGANIFLSKPVTLLMIEKALIELKTLNRPMMIMEEDKEKNKFLQILVIDDDIFCSQIFVRQLLQNGFVDVHASYSGVDVIIFIFIFIFIYIYIYIYRHWNISEMLWFKKQNILL